VIQPVVEPVNATVAALAAMRSKPSNRKSSYGDDAPVAQPAMVM